ncbi:MAG TPA: VanZ family protein [Burkholderiaceae bacterium]|nr:VanZ family protein [Burkholderiaceae bacterium]
MVKYTAKTQHQTIAWPFTLVYLALVVYASLYPFEQWRDQGVVPWAFIFQPWPKYWTWFDIVINMLGYAPLGFLGALTALRMGYAKQAVWLVSLLTLLLSFLLESIQSYLPARVSSNVDFILNVFGAFIGVVCAWGLERIGAINHWHQFKTKWFIKDSRGAMVLLGLWPVALIFPAAVPLGLGHVLERFETYLGEALLGTAFLEWLPMRSVELEPLLPGAEVLCVVLGAVVPVLLGYSIITHTPKRLIFLMTTWLGAIMVTSLSTALSFGPEHAWVWISYPVKVGLMLAFMISLFFLILPVRACLAMLLMLQLVLLFVLNLAPTNPYFAQTLQTWEQGRFIRFHGVAQWLGWLWPFVVMGYALVRVSSSKGVSNK